MNVALTIDNIKVEAETGKTILEAARSAGIYIPALCSHPALSPISISKVKARNGIFRGGEFIKGGETDKRSEGCQLCLIEMEGREGFFRSCDEPVNEGIVIHTDTVQLRQIRSDNLAKILAEHPHTCLVCPQRKGCDNLSCSLDVPKSERCCQKFNNCELRKVAEHIGIKQDLFRYIPVNLPVVEQEPLFKWDYNLCINCLRCVRVCEEVRGVGALGYVLVENAVRVGSLGPTLKESGCKFCGACVEVCPTGALSDKEMRGGERASSLVPCKNACPAGIDIPRFVNYISKGEFDKAIAVVREKVPLPSILGAVCFHPCEVECRRGEVNEPVAICALKRFVAENDRGIWKEKRRKLPPTGKRVAVIGSGPAGLVAAYYLATLGHGITVFEKESKLGGMLRFGIPYYRLSEDALEKDIEGILDLGVELKTGAKVGDGLRLTDIKSGFDSVFIAIGASLSRRLKIEGVESDGVLWGVDFLRDVSMGNPPAVKERVVVIGGGNVAIDVALTALRLGAKDVQMACLEKRKEMPANKWEIDQAEEEGIRIDVSWGPKRVLNDKGSVSGIELMRCINVFDEDGKFNPSYDEDEVKTIECDCVIMAIGQACDLSLIEEMPDIKHGRGVIEIDKDQYTGVKGIFAGGDVALVPGSVVDAVKMGRGAAIAIDRYLGGEGNIDEILTELELRDPQIGKAEGFGNWSRVSIPCLLVEDRKGNFNLVEQLYSEEEAIKEASRCLQCDLRLKISPCMLPPEKWVIFNEENVKNVPDIEGVYQLFDSDKNVLFIKGAMNVRLELEEELANNKKARFFIYEVEPMYTKKESELLQQYLQQHRRLPPQNSDLDDLF